MRRHFDWSATGVYGGWDDTETLGSSVLITVLVGLLYIGPMGAGEFVIWIALVVLWVFLFVVWGSKRRRRIG